MVYIYIYARTDRVYGVYYYVVYSMSYGVYGVWRIVHIVHGVMAQDPIATDDTRLLL